MEELIMGENGRVVLPQPAEISEKAKDDAMGAYLMMFAAWGLGLPLPFLGLVASFIYYMLNKKESRFTAFHAYQALLFHALVSILNAMVVLWTILALASEKIHAGVPFFSFMIFTVIWNLIYMVFSIIACVKAKKGRFYYFLVFGRVAFGKFYGPKALKKTGMAITPENAPPKGF